MNGFHIFGTCGAEYNSDIEVCCSILEYKSSIVLCGRLLAFYRVVDDKSTIVDNVADYTSSILLCCRLQEKHWIVFQITGIALCAASNYKNCI